MSFLKQKIFLLLLLFIIIFIGIRSIHFADSLNFSSDQAAFSIKAYQIFKDRELTLIGPPTSINFEGRQIFQGSVIYYFLLLFLLAGQFNPVFSSYIFMIFCSLMIVPLFIGTKLLINKNAAWFMVIIYTLLPYYVDYTKFLWNPNFQLSLSPLLILLIGYYKKRPINVLLFLVGGLSGLLLQFHYQFFLVIIFLIIYYFFTLKRKSKLVFLILGDAAGFSPILLFEIRNNFYNLKTLILYLSNYKSISSTQNDFQSYQHYLLVISFLSSALISYFLRKFLNKNRLVVLFFVLAFVSLIHYLPQPISGFRMSDNWSYPKEEIAFNIIRSQNLQNYNVSNLIYDTKAQVQKYLIIKNNLSINSEDYGGNNLLFVVSSNSKDLFSDPAFEITSLKPFVIVNRWPIDSFHSLYLLKKLPSP